MNRVDKVICGHRKEILVLKCRALASEVVRDPLAFLPLEKQEGRERPRMSENQAIHQSEQTNSADMMTNAFSC